MFQRIWAMGDIHGSYIPIKNFWERNKNNINFSKETDCIILLGDVGANYFLDKKDKEFKSTLGKYPFTYFCIRGNHEERPSTCTLNNPDQWSTETFFNNKVYVEKDYSYIKYALDEVAIYNILNYKTLIIPGAYSVDKYYRLINHWNWFENEQLSLEEIERGKKLIQTHNYNFDLVLSHTCPVIYEPTDLFLPQIDQSMVDRTMEQFLGEVEYNISYKLWLWGHYHHYRVYPKHNNSQCIMLSDGKEAINIQDCLNNFENVYIKY